MTRWTFLIEGVPVYWDSETEQFTSADKDLEALVRGAADLHSLNYYPDTSSWLLDAVEQGLPDLDVALVDEPLPTGPGLRITDIP